MSQKVKVFRSKDPLLGVLMWGVSHSVSTNFAKLPTNSFDLGLSLVVQCSPPDQRTLACE